MPCCAWLRRLHNAGQLLIAVKNRFNLRNRNLMRRNYMLDVIIVIVTILSFVVLIGFTEGCERL
jgi:hypothetical protein